MESAEKQPHTDNRKVPADKGLTGLGLVMQLAGSIFLAYGAFLALAPVLGNGSSKEGIVPFFIGVASIVRSGYHRTAGTALLYGAPKGAVRAVRSYVVVGIVHSAGVFFLMQGEDYPSKFTFGILAVLLAWPLALGAVFATKRYRGWHNPPKAEDMGFESAAVLMLLFGLLGVLVSGIVLLSMLLSSRYELDDIPSILWLAIVTMLVTRSVLHVRAGLSGIQGQAMGATTQRANQYISLSITISIILGALSVLEMMMTAPGINLGALIVAALATYLLLTWPLALRRFFTDRNFAMLLDEEASPQRAPDAGLTALGWLLFATGVVSLATAFAIVSGHAGQDSLVLITAVIGKNHAHSMWWSVALSALQVLAGFELIRMGTLHRILTTLFGVVAIGITLYLFGPALLRVGKLSLAGAFLTLIQPLASLGFPAAAIYLVHRKALK